MTTSDHSAVFVDTSGWTDPILQNTTNYQAMVAHARQLATGKRRILTTNYVITEVVALLTARAHKMPRANLIQFINRISAMPLVEIIHIDPATHLEAWALLERATDKEWSLVDATSFVLMRRRGITEVFTSDHHFAQAGFIRVPFVS